jgi:hypothetical protein|tara:strand:- start:10 stop:492 length:483 start_codon:yes stop_codon:yes gene_type:complete
MGSGQQLQNVIAGQFEDVWDMFQEAIEAFPDERWRKGDVTYLTPARIAYHIIETIDYYGRQNIDTFVWGHRAGINWETAEQGDLPSRNETLAYFDDVREANGIWLCVLGTEGLLAEDVVFHDEGMTHLDRVLYMMRHTHQHLGELCAELRRNELSRPTWR